jgi:von Willebrand factor type A domain/Aerotolerance regulator N-terminal
MGLAAPLLLAALALVGIPLWIHRVRRRSLVTRQLPTVVLLARALEQRQKRMSFRDRRLLYVRLAITALVAFALARPYLSRVASYASERPVALAIVIDDSMSMGRRKDRTNTLLEAAAARAEQVLSELAPESEVSVVLGGRSARLWLRREKNLETARERLRSVPPSGARGTDLPRAIELAAAQLGGSSLGAREILVLSDCARHADVAGLSHPELPLRSECLKPRPAPPNAYVSSLALATPNDVAEGRTLEAELRSSAEVSELEVEVRIDGERHARENVHLEGGVGRLSVALPQAALATAHLLRVAINTPNALAADDARELRLDAEGTTHVLLVDGDPADQRRDDELHYVSLALALAGGDLSLTRIDADGLDATSLSDFDVVLLGNVRAPQGPTAEELVRFVERGGGLLISMGDNVDAFAYRSSLGAVLPSVVRSSAPADPPATLPVGAPSELLPDAARGLDTTRTWKRMLVETPAPPASTVLSYADGAPLLVTAPHGAGRVALYTTSLDDAWTDIPLSPGFLPLIHGLVRGLSPAAALPPGPHVAGTVLEARVPGGITSLYMLTPDGRRVDLSPERGSVRIDDTATPGVYRLFAPKLGSGGGEIPHLTFATVPDLADSDTGEGQGLAPQDPETTLRPSVGHPRGIDPWFWLALGLCALAEGLLRRTGRAPTPAPAA